MALDLNLPIFVKMAILFVIMQTGYGRKKLCNIFLLSKTTHSILWAETKCNNKMLTTLNKIVIQGKVPDGKWTRKPLAYRESNNV